MRETPPDDTGSRRRATPVAGSADRYEALLEVLEQQADQTVREGPPKPGGGGRRAKLIALGVLVALTAWLWIMPPAWLVPPGPEPPSVEQEEASLRFAMYLQAQRIRSYQMRAGALPETLAEAGPPLPGMEYLVLPGGVYELTGATERLRLTYRSSEPLQEWVGSGASVLRESDTP